MLFYGIIHGFFSFFAAQCIKEKAEALPLLLLFFTAFALFAAHAAAFFLLGFSAPFVRASSLVHLPSDKFAQLRANHDASKNGQKDRPLKSIHAVSPLGFFFPHYITELPIFASLPPLFTNSFPPFSSKIFTKIY